MKKCRVAEFNWEHGLSLKNLKKIIYDRRKCVWLSPYYCNSFTKAELERVIDIGMDVNSYLSIIEPSRVMIQYQIKIHLDRSSGEIRRAEYHAAALCRIN